MRDEHNTDDLIDLGAVSVETKGDGDQLFNDIEVLPAKIGIGLADD